MIQILLIILFVLMFFIGGNRGVISMIALIGNIAVVLLSLVFIYWGVNPLLVTFISCILITCETLFYQNGRNYKTIAAFISVVIVMILLLFIVCKFGYSSYVGGFDIIRKRQDDMIGMSINININMIAIGISVIIIGLIGAIIDTAIAVSTAVYEVYLNNPHLTRGELFKSGINIGKDILGTTVNTLFFAYFSESLMVFIYLINMNNSISKIINSKIFFQEFLSIVFSAIASILIIPITAYVMSIVLTNQEKFNKFANKEE